MKSDEREERLKQIRKRRAMLLEQRPALSWEVNPFDCLCDEACKPFMVNAPTDIDFLLSLLDSDSQAAEPRYRVMAQAVWDKFWDDPTSDRWSVEDVANVLRAAGASGDAAVGAGLSSPCEADSISAAAQSVTAMRDKCVEKVKVLRERWADNQQAFGANNAHAHIKWGTMVGAATDVIAELQSLTLDQVQEKQ